jgi:hypothetical protein
VVAPLRDEYHVSILIDCIYSHRPLATVVYLSSDGGLPNNVLQNVVSRNV